MKRRREPSDVFDLLGCGVGFALTVPLWIVIQKNLPHADGPGPLLFYGLAALPGLLVGFKVAHTLRERVPKGLAILVVVGVCFLGMAAKAILQPHGGHPGAPTPGRSTHGHPPTQPTPPTQPAQPAQPSPAQPSPAPVVSRTLDPRAQAVEDAARAAEDR